MLERVKTQLNRLRNKQQRIFAFAFIAFVINVTYGLGNAVIGFAAHSWWFLTVSAYYIILSIMRFALVISEKQSKTDYNEIGAFAKRFSGAMLLCMALVLACTVLLTVKNDVGTKYHEIIMITIAAYTFTKLVFAIINFCKSQNFSSPIIKALQNLSVADAAVSIFSLQRSMLTSFEGMTADKIRLFNVLTGSGVCCVVLILGINLLRKDKKNGKIKNSKGE